MSTVYIIQNQLIYRDGRWSPKFDFIPAQEFGRLVYLLDPKTNQSDPQRVIEALHEQLRHYTVEDYLLLVGNPCLIGWATAIAAQHSEGAVVKMLQWSGKDRKYVPVVAKVL